jgi:hypothetical protein
MDVLERASSHFEAETCESLALCAAVQLDACCMAVEGGLPE